MNKGYLIALCALLNIPSVAFSQSLAEQERWAVQTSYSDRHVEDLKTRHDAFVPLTYDKASWEKVLEKWGEGTPSGRCKDVYDALDAISRSSEVAKKTVASKVKGVTCGYGGKTSGYKLSFSGGIITYAVEVDKANVVELIAGELKKKL